MSTRTIVEINHDYLSELLGSYDPFSRRAADQDQSPMLDFLWGLRQGVANPSHKTQGVRVLGQRHHSDTLHLKVE